MEVEPFLAAHQHRDATRRRLGYGPEHVVVGKVARLFYLKGHEYVIHAARRAVARQPNLRFLFVGDGILADQIRRRVRQTGLEEYVQFTGLVPPEQIAELIGGMDIVVHASLREGLARVLPQALIAGKPVVSYDIDGAREVVIPGETGFLLPPQSIGEMADALCALAADSALRERMGRQGRERFTDQFRHERMTIELRSLYERLLESKREARPLMRNPS
jgi:glycosyltransferase involved in cell wall biosynthesis